MFPQEKAKNSKAYISKKEKYLHTGIYFPDKFSVKKGSLSSGKNSESYCPFPWKGHGERKERAGKRREHAFSGLGATYHTILIKGERCYRLYVNVVNPTPLPSLTDFPSVPD